MDKKTGYIFALGAGMVCFIVYVVTLNPGAGFMDSGELSGALYTFGIPHPTGYPLYLVIGYVVSNLPLVSIAPVYKLNLLSAVFSACAVFVLFFVIKNMLQILNSVKEVKLSGGNRQDKGIKPSIGETEISVIALFSAIVIGISNTFWSNATSVEVYALHELFLALIILYSVKIYRSLAAPDKKNFIYLFLITGFSLSNHLTTILLLPGILYILYLQIKKGTHSRKMILASIIYIIPGLLMYIVLILRASSMPFFNWSNPYDITNLLFHITGREYSQVMFSGSSAFSNNFKMFTSGFIGEYAVIASVLGVYGGFIFYKKQKQLFAIIVIWMVSSLLYALNYNVRDIGVYFIQFYIVYGIFVASGIMGLIQFLIFNLKLRSKPVVTVIAAGLVLSAFGFYYNYERNNNSTNYVVEDLTLNTINSLEQNAIYITYDWGYSYPAVLYYQQAEHVRQDIKAFNVKFLSAPWYLEGIKKYYNDVHKNCSAEIDDYIKAVNVSDEKLQAAKLNALVKAFFVKNFQIFPLYVSVDILLTKELKPIVSGFTFIPFGLAYKMVNKTDGYVPSAGVECLNTVFRSYKADNTEKRKVNDFTAGMFYETAFYHYKNKNSDLAVKFIDKSLSINNSFKDALNLKNKILSEQK